jgi:hypothetical protein
MALNSILVYVPRRKFCHVDMAVIVLKQNLLNDKNWRCAYLYVERLCRSIETSSFAAGFYDFEIPVVDVD